MHAQPVGNGTRRILFSAFYVTYFKVGLVWNMFERVQETARAWLLTEQYQLLKMRTRVHMRSSDFCGLYKVIFRVLIELCCCALLYAGSLAFCLYGK